MGLAGACDNLVFVYSLASASDTFAEETTELQELIRASARQERVLSPSTDVEIYNIVKQRLFTTVSAEAAEKAASEYKDACRASINLPDACKDARYSTAIASSYPFHPELFNLLTKKIASILTPGLEVNFVDRALERLTAVAWYLDDDPITSTSRFKEEPSINKIITEEKEQVGRSEAKDDLRSRRDSIFAKKIFTPIFSPEGSGDVDDVPDTVALCLIDFDEATVLNSTDSPPHIVEQIFNNTGESRKFRLYKNRLLFLVANKQEIERAIDNAREYKAIQNILKNQTRLSDLSGTQQKQLKQREGGKDLDVRIYLTNAYRHLFYPIKDDVKAPTGLMHYYVLPAQDSSTVKGNSNQQSIVLKALKDCEKIRPEGLKTSLYHDGNPIPQEFRPCDEYETTITNTSVFKVLADYGNGETAEQEAHAVIARHGRVKELNNKYNSDDNGNVSTGTIFDYQSPIIELDGTVNKVFAGLIDLCGDRKVKEIESIEISVDKLIDYRKLGTAIPLLSRFLLKG